MKIEGISRAIIVIIFINVNLLECQDISVRVKQGTIVGVGWSFCEVIRCVEVNEI